MGDIKGYVCTKCNYSKSYFLGIGFNGGKTKALFNCEECGSTKNSTKFFSNCSKCKKARVDISNSSKTLKFPKCDSTTFCNLTIGNWD